MKKQHPLYVLAKRVELSGKKMRSLRLMKLQTQGFKFLFFMVLIGSSLKGICPVPLELHNKRYFIYLDPKDPNSRSLYNQEPELYRFVNKIDLTKVPDVLQDL